MLERWKRVCDGDVGDREKWSSSCTVERGGTGDEIMVRIQQYEEPAQPPEAMSGSMVLPLLGSVLRSKTHAITKSQGLGCYLKLC